jgi:hypothetical protein
MCARISFPEIMLVIILIFFFQNLFLRQLKMGQAFNFGSFGKNNLTNLFVILAGYKVVLLISLYS